MVNTEPGSRRAVGTEFAPGETGPVRVAAWLEEDDRGWHSATEVRVMLLWAGDSWLRDPPAPPTCTFAAPHLP